MDETLQPETTQPTPPEEPPSLSEAVDIFLDKIHSWIELAVANLPNLIAAIIVFILFIFLGRVLKKIAGRLLAKTPVPNPIRNLLVTFLGVAVLVAGLFVALGLMGLDKTVASLLAGVGILGLALGFAFQDIAANFMAGVVIAFRHPFRINDIIETGDHKGIVDEIGLRSTVMHKFTGEQVRVPNKDIIANPLVNFTIRGELRVDITVGVAYGDDLEGAKRVVLEALSGLDDRDPEREPELFYSEFGASSINFVARFWIDFKRQKDLLTARSNAIIAIKKALDDGGYTIPFPIRTLDFGVVGGEPLKEHLAQQEKSARSQDRIGG